MPKSLDGADSTRSARPTTIIDIARVAGVSKSTVSRVINGNLNVSPETRAVVLETMNKLDFQLNAAARSLRANRTHLVGLLMPHIVHVFYSTTAEVLEHELRKEGMSLLIANSGGLVEGEINAINSLRSHGAEALILSVVNENDEALAAILKRTRQHLILLDREIPGVMADSVLIDPHNGIEEAVAHLTSLGHTRIALVTHGSFVRPGREVRKSFKLALTRFGLDPVSEALPDFEDITSHVGWTAAEEMVNLGATAILSLGPSTVTAGILNYLTWRGLKIPEDISIVVYDQTELASAMPTGLTAVVRPIEEYARLASQLLVSRLADPTAKPRSVTVPTRLVIRDSTGKVPAERSLLTGLAQGN
jgi:LacI family transcriptional regulator